MAFYLSVLLLRKMCVVYDLNMDLLKTFLFVQWCVCAEYSYQNDALRFFFFYAARLFFFFFNAVALNENVS